jgi:hypothetical protein
MTRLHAALAGTGLLLLLPAASAHATIQAHAHVQTASYVAPGGVDGVLYTDGGLNDTNLGSADVNPWSTDRYIRLSVVDVSGLPLSTVAFQKDGTEEVLVAAFCGTMPKAVKLPRPGLTVAVTVAAGRCGATPSAPTSGTITAHLAATSHTG